MKSLIKLFGVGKYVPLSTKKFGELIIIKISDITVGFVQISTLKWLRILMKNILINKIYSLLGGERL